MIGRRDNPRLGVGGHGNADFIAGLNTRPSLSALFTGIRKQPDIEAVAVRKVKLLIVTFTGGRALPHTSLGSNGKYIPQAVVLSSWASVVLNFLMVICTLFDTAA